MGNVLCGKNTYRLNRTREEPRKTVELEKLRRPEGAPARDVVLAIPRIIVTDDERSYVIFDPRESVVNEEEKKSIMLLGVKISKPKRFLRQRTVLTKRSDSPVFKAKTPRSPPDAARAAFTQSSIILNRMRPGSSPASSGPPSRLRAHSLLNMPTKSRNIPYRPSYEEPDSQNLCLRPMDTLQVPAPTARYSPPVIRAEVHQRSSPPVKSPDSGDSAQSSGSKRVAFESTTEQREKDQSKSIESEAGPSGRVTTAPKSTQTGDDLEDAQPGTSRERPEEHEAEAGGTASGSASDTGETKK
ncbi:uncharacterized protein [Euwallacea fornicatus]|uniref:uncharacterized protein n=1 Tax=Euwallacea fornicatus TaxID=995702 RepID=UPI00338D3EF1